MRNFAKVEGDKVTQVLVLSDDKDESWLAERLGGQWIETFEDGGSRKNFAGVGHTYDPEKDAFIPRKKFDSWILNEETCQWEAPKPRPEGRFAWNEEVTDWVEIPESTD